MARVLTQSSVMPEVQGMDQCECNVQIKRHYPGGRSTDRGQPCRDNMEEHTSRAFGKELVTGKGTSTGGNDQCSVGSTRIANSTKPQDEPHTDTTEQPVSNEWAHYEERSLLFL